MWLFGRTWAKQRAVELREIRLKSLFKLINKILRHDISGKLTTVRYGIETSEIEGNEGIDMAYQAAADGIELVRQMKILEKLAAEDVDLQAVDVRGEIEVAAKSYSIPLYTHGNATVLADPALRSVFENLIRNAVVHSGTDKIHVEINVRDGDVEVRVVDFGKGIPEKYRKTLFTEGGKFGETGNTGLGLYIVKETIKRYGGSVRYEATKPHGATFVLTLKKAG
ncbi:sensor histidine kinase [Patescibacteria group bacterium]